MLDQDLEKLREFDRRRQFGTPEAKELARDVYERGLPSHRCYANDRFYLAVRLGLDEGMQYAAAGAVRSNGISGYFEAITHFGFDLRGLLIELGVPETELPAEGHAYAHLNARARKVLTDKFGLVE